MSQTGNRIPTWPAHLNPGAVRFSYASGNYDATIAFYRDVVGLPLLAEFTGSFGEDGTVFGLPSVQAHLEIVRAQGRAPAVDPLDQLVFYLSGAQAAATAAAPLKAAGAKEDVSPHPYWAARGAIVYLDPDGRRVVFAPWVFGIEPEPADANHPPP
jgi:catechol 2,3-dioxygenase-like lactoylglutathione lyase family enzyme